MDKSDGIPHSWEKAHVPTVGCSGHITTRLAIISLSPPKLTLGSRYLEPRGCPIAFVCRCIPSLARPVVIAGPDDNIT